MAKGNTKYIVLTPVQHDRKDYAPGSPIELTEEQAAPLILVKAIEEEKKPEPSKKD